MLTQLRETANTKTAEDIAGESPEQTMLKLYDFRSQPMFPPLQKTGNAEQSAVWKYVYGAGRKMEIGEFGEFVDPRFSGAFTTPGAKETVSVVKSNQSANNLPTETWTE